LKNLFILLIVAVIISGCEEKFHTSKPDQLLDEKVYVDIFYELELLKMYQNRGALVEKIDSLYLEIFKKHETDTALFRQSHEFYQTQTDKQQARVDSVISNIEKELHAFDRLDSVKAQEKELKE
jgi:hypothetical protein